MIKKILPIIYAFFMIALLMNSVIAASVVNSLVLGKINGVESSEETGIEIMPIEIQPIIKPVPNFVIQPIPFNPIDDSDSKSSVIAVDIYTENGRTNYDINEEFSLKVDASDSIGLYLIQIYKYDGVNTFLLSEKYCNENVFCSLKTKHSESFEGDYDYIGYAINIYGSDVDDIVSVTIEHVNTAPTINIPNQNVLEDSAPNPQLVDLWNYADDLETPDSRLNFAIISQTNTPLINCNINNNRYVGCNSPAADQTGSTNITVFVQDEEGATAYDTFNLEVTEVNDGPIISPLLPDVFFNEDESATLNLNNYVVDIDTPLNMLQWSVSGENNIQINIVNGIANFAADANWSGTDAVTFRVFDGQFEDTDDVNVIVLPVNDAPWINPILPNQTVNEDDIPWTLDLSIYENDVEDSGADLYWTVENVNNSLLDIVINNTKKKGSQSENKGIFKIFAIPRDNDDGMPVKLGLATFTLVPNANGVNIVTFVLHDSEGLIDSQEVVITVNSINDAPVAQIFAPVNGSIFQEGEAITFLGLGTDIEDGSLTGNSLTWNSHLDNNFGNGTFVSTANLSVGQHFILLQATDSEGATNTDLIIINIHALGAEPVVELITPVDGANILTADVTLTYNVSDDQTPNLNCTLWTNITGAWTDDGTHVVLNGATDSFNLVNLADGNYMWNVECRDDSGNSAFAPANWTFIINTSQGDYEAPVITFILPTPNDGSTIDTNWAFINTTITDNIAVDTAILEWNSVNETMSNIGINYYVNKTNLADGIYTYRVHAKDTSNNWAVSETRTLTIDTAIQFHDIAIESLTLFREVDNLNKSIESTTVYLNDSIYVLALVHNLGNVNETVNITLQNNIGLIDSKLIELEAGETNIASFVWNAYPEGWHTVKVTAKPVTGETNFANNELSKDANVWAVCNVIDCSVFGPKTEFETYNLGQPFLVRSMTQNLWNDKTFKDLKIELGVDQNGLAIIGPWPTTQYVDLNPGQFIVTNWNVISLDTGDYPITVKAGNEYNKTKYVTIE